MTIEVTQYIRPDGKKRTHLITVDSKFKEKYEVLTRAGARFSLESLPLVDQVALAIEHFYGDYMMDIYSGETLVKGVERMLEKLNVEDFRKWLQYSERLYRDE